MKKFFILIYLCTTAPALTAELSVSCPSGYYTIKKSYIILRGPSEGNPPDLGGFTKVDTVLASCFDGSIPDSKCFLYAQSDTNYSDNSGTYQFSEICPLL